MQKSFLLIMLFLVSSWRLQGETKSYNIVAVNLITEREVEIVCATKPTNANEVYNNFIVTVDGKKVEYAYLSYFDFGPYAKAPVINIRLAKPLNVGTLRGKTGNARTPGEMDNAQTSFAVKVNGMGLGFRYFKSDANTVTLYLNWPLEKDDMIEITVLTTGEVISTSLK